MASSFRTYGMLISCLTMTLLLTYFHARIAPTVKNRKLLTSLDRIEYNAMPSFELRHIVLPHRAVEVVYTGAPLLARIKAFNTALGVVRTNVARRRGGLDEPWQLERSVSDATLITKNMTSARHTVQTVVHGSHDDFLQTLSKFPQATTIILPWVETSAKSLSEPRQASTSSKMRIEQIDESSNLLVNEYYVWSAAEALCAWINGTKNNNYYNVMFKYGCNTNIAEALIEKPITLPRVFLNIVSQNRVRNFWKVVKDEHNNSLIVKKTTEYDYYNSSPPILTYCHVFHDASVTGLGDVFTYDMKFVNFGCTTDGNPELPSDTFSRPIYDEVLVITQEWGWGTFHRLIEIVPRLVLFLDFLASRPNVKVLAPEGDGGRLAEFFRILGLDPATRLVTGYLRAKIVFLPRASMCGTANVPEIQLMSMLFRNYTSRHLFQKTLFNQTTKQEPEFSDDVSSEIGLRNKVILIRRTGTRRLAEQSEIETVLSAVAKDYGLVYEMFIDNPSPSLNDTMKMFYTAVMVVGPHGAGLSNMVFCQPGTYIIEGVCNVPHVNLCNQRTAVVLGHHWHGMQSKQGCEGVVDIAATDVDKIVRTYLNFRNKKYRSPGFQQ